MARSRLIDVLESWQDRGDDLGDLLALLPSRVVRTPDDARAVARAAEYVFFADDAAEQPGCAMSTIQALVTLFHETGSDDAFQELARRGIPRMARLYREGAQRQDADPEDLLALLRVLSWYQCADAVDFIHEAIQAGLAPDAMTWGSVFECYGPQHAYAGDLLATLSDRLPQAFCAVAFLDFANSMALQNALATHPFDTPAGVRRLRDLIQDGAPERHSCAQSAAAALPFLTLPDRDGLLELAAAHPDNYVRLEAAWAGARLGSQGGRAYLREHCLDLPYAKIARSYLEELGFDDAVPPGARDPEFDARAELCDWLSHPHQAGRPPDTLELFDTKELYWPPTRDRRRLWLFRYAYTPSFDDERDFRGVGLVGSVTFAIFSEPTDELSPEDVYALHCCWELEAGGDPRAPERPSPEEGRRLLTRYNPGVFDGADDAGAAGSHARHSTGGAA